MKWKFAKKMWRVKKHERGILFKDGDFDSILLPGEHTRWDLKNRYTVQIVDIHSAKFVHPLADYLRRYEPQVVETHFDALTTDIQAVGLRYEDDALVEIIPPSAKRLYWKGLKSQRFAYVALTELKVSADVLTILTKPSLRAHAIEGLGGILQVTVPAYAQGVLRVNGKVVELLSAGLHGFWQFNRDITVDMVDTRMQALEINGQEILTKDKVNLRINLTAIWQLTDLLLAYEKNAKPADYLYRELQFILRELVATRTLDQLLEDKQALDQLIAARFNTLPGEMGIELSRVGIKDIILPGEMKTLMAQVVEAEKAAEANVIRRREEAANTRTMLNTAKLMEENPVTMRLKELETLERIANRIDKFAVYGGLDQVLNGLVKIG